MAVQSIEDLFVEELRDLYHAEKQLTRALPRMAKAASSDDLRTMFNQHLEETRGQIERLEEAFEMLDVAKRGKRCEAMEGLVEEGREMMEEVEEKAVLDVGLITAAQKIEHYEIAGYGSAVALARAMGKEDIAKLLEQTLEEEKRTDQKLNQIAAGGVNQRAIEAHGMDEAGDEGSKRSGGRSGGRKSGSR